MSMLSSRPSAKPLVDENIVPKFYRSSVKEVKQVIYDLDGKISRTDLRQIPFSEEIPDSELEHRGVSCDMFTIENMQAAGVEMSPVNKPLFGLTLDARSEATEAIENIDFTELTDNDFNSNSDNKD